SGDAQPIEFSVPPKVAVRLSLGAGHLNRDGRKSTIEAIEFTGRVMKSGVEIEQLALRSSAAEATVSGRLDDWRALRYRLNMRARADLEETFAFFAPKFPIKGRGSFDGLVEGEGARWRASGRASSDELTVAGITYRDARADFARVDPRDGKWTFSSELAKARSVAAGKIEFTNPSASKVSGTVIDGRAKITANQATIGRVKIGDSEFNEIALRDIGATFEKGADGGQWTISTEQARVRSVSTEGVEFTTASASKLNATISGGRAHVTSDQATAELVVAEGIEFTNAAASKLNTTVIDGRAQIASAQATVGYIKAGQGEFNDIALRGVTGAIGSGVSEARGDLSLRDGSWEKIAFGQTTGQFAADRKEISLRGFNTAVLNGGVTGDLIVRLTPEISSTLRAEFTGVQTAELFSMLGVQNDHLAGTVTGRADVTWPGANLRLINGDLSARFDGQTTSTPDAVPVRGEVTASARSGVFDFSQFTFRTDASTVTATGKLAISGDSDLRFSLTSTRAEELQTILNSSGLATGQLERLLKTYEPHLFGDFSFTGTLAGQIENPTIAGDAVASSFGLRDEILGSVRGRVLVSPAEFRFERGSLTTDDGGSLTINYAAPRDATATQGRLDLTFERINIDRLLGAFGLGARQKFVTGAISGEAHLTGLPAAPQGDVNLNLVDGVIAGQAAESATAVIKFDGQTARIERVEAKLPQGRFVASGSVNLQTNEYQFQGQAEQLALERIAEAFELSAARIAGVADATFQVSGDFDSPKDFKIELTAQGRQVTVNGREAGPVTLTARTTPDGRVEVDLTTEIAGRQQPINASIELRQPGRPVEIRADLANFDLAPVISIFAPELARSINGQVTGALRVSGPTVNAQGEATVEDLRGSLSLTDLSLQVAGASVNVATPLTVTLGDKQLRVEPTRITAQGTDLRLEGAIALGGGAPINFSINGQVNLGAFVPPGSDLALGGVVEIDARVGGTFNDPRLAGEARLRNVSLISADSPVTLEEGNGRIIFSGNRLTLENFTARAGDGSLQAQGEMTLAQFRPTEWRSEFTANNVDVLWQGLRATANGQLTLAGTPQGQKLSGAITIPLADYTSGLSLGDLSERGRISFGGLGGGEITARGGGGIPPTSLDVRIEAVDSIVINSKQVNTVASAAFNLAGTLDKPEVTGRVTFESGAFIFRGQRYDITSGLLDLPGGGAEPQAQLLAEGEIKGYRVYIRINGPTSSLNLALSSEPDLSQTEIISLITTGNPETGAQAGADLTQQGLSAAASLLSDEFISKPLGREAERFLGINRFQIEPVLRPFENPAARLTVGRQIAHGLTFIYSTNLASNQDQSGLVQYDITRNFQFLAAYTQSGDIQLQAPDANNFAFEFRGRSRYALGVIPPAATPAPGATAGVPAPSLSRPAIPKTDVRVNLGASGSKEIEISERRLRELLPVMSEGFSRARLRLGERNLANYLQEKGYFFADVRARCEPADCQASGNKGLRVFYEVRPGARYQLKAIRFTGAEELKKPEALDGLQSKEMNRLGEIPVFKSLPFVGGLARGITSNDRLRADRETIRERLVDLGYRSARVESRLAVSHDSDDLVVVFDAVKGPRSVVEDIVVRGNAVAAASELREAALVKRGDFFSGDGVREGADRIRDFYTTRGYLDAKTEVSLMDLPNDRVRLIYDVSEGTRAVATQVVVTGQTITREGSIRRFFNFKPGEMLTPKLLRDTVRDLYETSAFREVNIRTEPIAGASDDARQVSVNVTEAKPLQMYYGLGYSTDTGPRGTLQLTNTNLFGRVMAGSLRLLASRVDQLAQISLTDLRPGGAKWPTTISAFYNRDANVRPYVRRQLVDGAEQPSTPGQPFGINRFTAFIQTQRKLSDLTGIRFRYSFENSRLFNLENIPDIEVTRHERSIRLGALSAGYTRETRDNTLWPTRGHLFSADYSFAARALGGNESYNKLFAGYQRYDTPPAFGKTTIAVSGRVGLASLFAITDRDGDGMISEPERILPINERFFAGGATTLRGFRFDEAGPQAVLEPRNPN
ncbi:MAG: translocation/assembly module TamB domain-containing protein, partial [Blastocatellia bacterium]